MPFEVQGPITYDASRLYFPKASEFKTGASLDTLNHVVISFVKSKEFQAYLHAESSGSNRLQIDARVIKDHIFVKINGREEKEFSLTTRKVERTANRILDEAKKVWEEKDSSLTDRSIQPFVMAPLTAKDPQVARLKREIAQLKQQLASIESNPRRQATNAIEMDSLQEALFREELEASRRSFESDLASKTATIRSLESQLASLEEAHGLDNAASRLQIATLRHQLGSVKASKEDLARQAANLTSQIYRLSSTNNSLSSALDESRTTSAREKSDFEARIAQLTSAFTDETGRLKGLIRDLRTQNEGLLSTIAEKQAQLTALELQQAATASALTSSKALSAQEKISHEEALSTLQSSIAALREELKAAKASSEEKQGQIISLTSDLAEKEMAHETALTLQAETLRQEHRSSLEKEKKALVFADRMTRGVWHLAYTKQILELRRNLEELIATTEAKKEEEKRKKEALEKEFAEKEARLLEDRGLERTHHEEEVSTLRQELDKAERQIATFTSQIATLTSKVRELEAAEQAPSHTLELAARVDPVARPKMSSSSSIVMRAKMIAALSEGRFMPMPFSGLLDLKTLSRMRSAQTLTAETLPTLSRAPLGSWQIAMFDSEGANLHSLEEEEVHTEVEPMAWERGSSATSIAMRAKAAAAMSMTREVERPISFSSAIPRFVEINRSRAEVHPMFSTIPTGARRLMSGARPISAMLPRGLPKGAKAAALIGAGAAFALGAHLKTNSSSRD